MTINLGIPQIIWLVMAIFGLIYEVINHGKPPTAAQCLRLHDWHGDFFLAALFGRLLRINPIYFNSLFFKT